MFYLVVLIAIFFAPLSWGDSELPARNCKHGQGAKLDALKGTVFFDPGSKGHWQQARLNEFICEGSQIKVEPYSSASLSLTNGVILRLDEGTVLSLNGISPDKPTLLDLLKGFILFISRTPKPLEITSPIANAGPEGTEFAMRVDDASASLWVYEGGVKFFNDRGSVHLKPGQGADALLGQAPQTQITLKPQDAVNWALYYPAILPFPDPATRVDSEVLLAIQAFRQGSVDEALIKLDALPDQNHTPYFYKVRGAMRLTAGRVTLALQDIQALLANKPNDAEALALQSIVALIQNRKEEAYTLAKQAVAADAHSSVAYSALSYVEQGRFELDKALAAADQAVKYAPHDAMTWARKAELALSKGSTADSEASVKQALKLDANLERTQTVRGFSALLRMDTDDALRAFEKAIQLDSTSPLARLGLGLTKIRQGHLHEGRQDLEIAAVLDPNNSLIRSYLGKAYYEERRSFLADDQFTLAKDRDPKDPTPFFYDAILKQSYNRPVEALKDMQQAIALNENRGVYRSKLQLDEDRGARSVSLARIYNNLGFDQLAVNTSTSSLTRDHANYSAHRFLFDSYALRPRYESARVSELLQSQLLQPININPVQPETVETNLNILSGTSPSSVGFNEFTALFDRNRDQFISSGIVGNHNTYADQAVLAGTHNQFSYSLGQFHYQNQGFRDNFALQHDLYNIFLQTALTSKLNIQFEYRHRETLKGDLSLSLLNDPSYTHVDLKSKQDIPRLGIHYAINERSDIVFSFMHADKRENYIANIAPGIYFENDPAIGNGELKNSGNDFQGQYLFKWNKFNLSTGLSYFNIDNKLTRNVTDKNNILISPDYYDSIPFNSEWFDVYLYAHGALPKNLYWTIGVSYVSNSETKKSMSINFINTQRINPKIGLEWSILDNLKLRMGYFETVKRTLLFEQTIEPTQVARFNQFFDDANGTIAKNKTIGLDFQILDNYFAGIELVKRDLAFQYTFEKKFENQYENQYRAYFYWMPNNNWTLSAKYNFEQFNRDPLRNEDGKLIEQTPSRLFTMSVPVTLRYFNPNGFFWSGGFTYVQQTVTYPVDMDVAEKHPEFVVVDTNIGYRLPNRCGLINLEIKNLFNNNFQYQDNSLLGNNYNQPIYSPDRTIIGQLLLTF